MMQSIKFCVHPVVTDVQKICIEWQDHFRPQFKNNEGSIVNEKNLTRFIDSLAERFLIKVKAR